GTILAKAKLNRSACNGITREQATTLLEAARDYAKSVTPERLGAVGPDALPDCAYAVDSGVIEFGSVSPMATIPFVVEVWADKVPGEVDEPETCLTVCVNRTPVTGEIHLARDKRDINAFGCGLSHNIAQAPREVQFLI